MRSFSSGPEGGAARAGAGEAPPRSRPAPSRSASPGAAASRASHAPRPSTGGGCARHVARAPRAHPRGSTRGRRAPSRCSRRGRAECTARTPCTARAAPCACASRRRRSRRPGTRRCTACSRCTPPRRCGRTRAAWQRARARDRRSHAADSTELWRDAARAPVGWSPRHFSRASPRTRSLLDSAARRATHRAHPCHFLRVRPAFSRIGARHRSAARARLRRVARRDAPRGRRLEGRAGAAGARALRGDLLSRTRRTGTRSSASASSS